MMTWFNQDGRQGMKTMKRGWKKTLGFVRSSRAVSALEYAILVGVIAAAVGAALFTFGENIADAITEMGTEVSGLAAPEIDIDGS